VLGENGRGAVIEAVISRMKTFAYKRSVESSSATVNSMRFIAVSATIPNIDDVNVLSLTYKNQFF
jgi:replicative superfamily II helicase